MGAPLSPCSCVPCPCESCQLRASHGKTSPTGNYWSDRLHLGRRESPVAGASLHSPAFPSAVPSSLLSPLYGPHRLHKPTLAIIVPGLGFSSHPTGPLKKPLRDKHAGSMGRVEPQRQAFPASSSPARPGHTQGRVSRSNAGSWFSWGFRSWTADLLLLLFLNSSLPPYLTPVLLAPGRQPFKHIEHVSL